MCGGGGGSSSRDREAADRRHRENMARQREQMEEQKRQFEAQQAAAERRYQEQLAMSQRPAPPAPSPTAMAPAAALAAPAAPAAPAKPATSQEGAANSPSASLGVPTTSQTPINIRRRGRGRRSMRADISGYGSGVSIPGS